jgi:8-oxo-dGTP diphosphatase
MIEYVVGIVLDEFDYVLLLRKNRPDWQSGWLNGIGGHIEEGESPYEAMVRECKEECGLELHNWLQLGLVTDNNTYKVHYFSAQTSRMSGAKSMTDEKVEIYHLSHLKYPELVPPTDLFIRAAINPLYKSIELVAR